MPKELPTPAQLKVYQILGRARMAWIAFWIVMGFFATIFGVFLYLVLCKPEVELLTKLSVAFIDGMLGFPLRQIIVHLFPTKSTAESAVSWTAETPE